MPENEVILRLSRRPNALANLALALCGIFNRHKIGDPVPKIKAVWEDVKINPGHVKDFQEICGLPPRTEFFYPLYPVTLIFPFIIRILGHKKAPLSVFRTLNTKLEITSHRRIGVYEPLTITCETGSMRIVSRGLEMDLASIVQTGHETVWESLHTFYYRGKFGKADSSNLDPMERVPIPEAKTLGSWYLPDGIGFRFGRISGDTNGIHYSRLYAKRFGFKRDFAQPTLVLTRSLNCFPDLDISTFRLVALLKGPVYYKSNVYLKGILRGDGIRFDIYCEDNPRPSLCCQVSY
jgi:hypothetical protein